MIGQKKNNISTTPISILLYTKIKNQDCNLTKSWLHLRPFYSVRTLNRIHCQHKPSMRWIPRIFCHISQYRVNPVEFDHYCNDGFWKLCGGLHIVSNTLSSANFPALRRPLMSTHVTTLQFTNIQPALNQSNFIQ